MSTNLAQWAGEGMLKGALARRKKVKTGLDKVHHM